MLFLAIDKVVCAHVFMACVICSLQQLGEQKKKFMPYNHQHKYFFISE